MSENIITFTTPQKFNKVRVDKVAHHFYPQYSRTQIQRYIDQGNAWLDEHVITKSHKVLTGDSIIIEVPELKTSELKAVNIPLNLIFEDKNLIVLNKKSGMIVHPGIGTAEDTLVHALLYHCQGNLSGIGGIERPGIVHRLDKETSGLMIVAKSDSAFQSLSTMFSERTIKKEYIALVSGITQLNSGTINKPIGRHPVKRHMMAVTAKGRFAKTDWELIEKFNNIISLLRIQLHTGRTHQIRVHLSNMGYPILGDTTYGYKNSNIDKFRASRVMLHSQRLNFKHPITGENLEFYAEFPEDFKNLLDKLR